MRTDTIGGVSPKKIEELIGRISRLGINPALIDERLIRGSGKGGQKINKTANCVQLLYAPMGLVVRCQRERSLAVNRFLALRELADRVEACVSPGTSLKALEADRIRRRKARRRRRARDKGPAPGPVSPG